MVLVVWIPWLAGMTLTGIAFILLAYLWREQRRPAARRDGHAEARGAQGLLFALVCLSLPLLGLLLALGWSAAW